MTRIIGGTAGGRRLRTPPGETTRPTTDRVREALFSAVDSALGTLTKQVFLDLYAGSGAVGLEARSRGARAVTLVEHDRRTAALISANARALGLDAVDVRVATAARFAARTADASFDVAFLDPPYAVPVQEVQGVLGELREHGWLAPDALVVVERSRRGPDLGWPEGFAPGRRRDYGETALWYGHATG